MAVEEQFILRVPNDVAEQLNQLLSKQVASSDLPIDLAFAEDGRSGTFTVGGRTLPASLLDLPGVVESWKTYDDNHLVKSADIGQLILVTEEGAEKPEGPEYRHGLTPPMREARRQRFRSEPDYDPEQVARVEKELERILAGGAARDMEVEEVLEDEDEDEGAEGTTEKKRKKKKKKKRSKDRDRDKSEGAKKEPTEDRKKEKSGRKKHKSRDKDGSRDEKSKDKKSKKRKKREKDASGDGLESDAKRIRVESESVAPSAAAEASVQGLEKGLGDAPSAAAVPDANGLQDSPDLDGTDADLERDLMESLEEANELFPGPEDEPGGRTEGNALEDRGVTEDRGGTADGLGGNADELGADPGGLGADAIQGNGEMFSFTGVVGLEGVELNDDDFHFEAEAKMLDNDKGVEEDKPGDGEAADKAEAMPWDL